MSVRFVRMGPGAEFDLIRSFHGGASDLPSGVLVGPGDDCAVIDAGQPLALSTDVAVEDVHFRRAWLEPEEIGWRAAAAALSDLAAVAAEPLGVLASLAMTAVDADSGWGSSVMSGVRAAASEVGAALVGGDLSRSPGPAFVNVTVVGRVARPVLRSGARAGDEVWVTGRLGGAAQAVDRWSRGEVPADAHRRAFARPQPRTREAIWIAQRAEVHAMIDLSDGLAGDAAHVAAASGVALDLVLARLPIAANPVDARNGSTESGTRPLDFALHGGEDYELLIAAAPRALAPIAAEFEKRFSLSLTRIGGVRDGDGVWSRDENGELGRLARGGFLHFQEGTPS